MLFSPWSSMSAAPSGLESWKLTVARCGMRTLIGLNEKVRFALVDQGPLQLFRAATVPSWLFRQSRALDEPLTSSDRMPAATVESVFFADGLKTNARSFA